MNEEYEVRCQHFAELKIKYQATDFEDTSPKCHLDKILKKVESGNFLGEQDVNYLKKRNLHNTVKVANNKYADVLKARIGTLDFFVDANIQWLENNGYNDIVKTAKDKKIPDFYSQLTISGHDNKRSQGSVYHDFISENDYSIRFNSAILEEKL